MKRLTVHLLWILLLLIAPAAIQSELSAQVSPRIIDIIEQSRASNAFWAVQVRDSSGTLIENYNGDKLIRPASNLKLVSSAAFLENLGHDYRFETTLYGRGEQQGNRWKGDLVVRGKGDPSINGEFFDDPLFLFEKWYGVLDSMGITVVDGNLVGHEGFFDDIPYPRGWEWDDLSYYYAPEISALSFNFNVADLEVLADGEPGTTPRIEWSPMNTPYVQFINEQMITPRGTKFNESYRRELGSNIIYLRSTLPQGYYETEPLSIHNPALYFVDTFKRYLQMRGIDVRGQRHTDRTVYDWDAGAFTVIDTHTSGPLSDMIQWLNVESDNFYTEMLLKTLAAETVGVEGSTELGLDLLKEFMHNHNFDTTAVILRDASGMAPATLLKTDDLNRFLFEIREKPWFDTFYSSLPVSGYNGTLRHRFRNSPVLDGFNGKTGFVSGVRALSGYLTTASGQTVVVTVVTNNYAVRTAVVDLIHERIIEYIYNAY